MGKRVKHLICHWVLVCCLAGLADGITTGQKIKTEGWIVSRQGNLFTMQTIDAGDIAVLVTPYTKVHEPKGLFKARKKQMPRDVLLPGLRVKIKGIGNTQGQVIAESVSFSGTDLRTAQAIRSGLITTKTRVEANTEQIASNQAHIETNRQQIAATQVESRSNQQQIANVDQRVSDLAQYAVKSTIVIYFPSASSTVNRAGQDILRRFASEAQAVPGYFIEIKGYADSSGSAESNQDLSMRRAQSVLSYLHAAGKVPLTRILTPAAMGENGTATSNRTPQGRAENRRVEVQLLVNRGLAGKLNRHDEQISMLIANR